MAYSRPFLRVLWLGLLLALLTGCGQSTDPGAEAVAAAPVHVRVVAVELSTHTPPVRAAAELARQTEAVLAFSGPGVVESVLVRPGDRVQQGQTLARLRPDTVDAQAVQATAALEQARRALARVERLHQERVATLEMLQDARTAVETAEAALRIAEFHRTFAVISAPASGVILRRFTEANELVAAGQPVLAFAGDDDGWIARAHLAARDVARIALGSPAELDDGSGKGIPGRVSRIAAAADGATRTVPIEITLPAAPAGAHSGRIVAARIHPLPVPPRQAVPLAAIREGAGERAFVFVLAPGEDVVRRVQIDIELIDDGRVFLRSPLPDGVQVVTSGAQFLREGSRVSITN